MVYKRKTNKENLGRPTNYNKEIAEKICDVVATNALGLVKICEKFPEFPSAETINQWRLHHQEFFAMYSRAKTIQVDLLAESCIDIAQNNENDIMINDDGKKKPNFAAINRDKLVVDTIKWYAGKLSPRIYCDRVMIENKTEENDQLKQEIKELRDKLDKQNQKEY